MLSTSRGAFYKKLAFTALPGSPASLPCQALNDDKGSFFSRKNLA